MKGSPPAWLPGMVLTRLYQGSERGKGKKENESKCFPFVQQRGARQQQQKTQKNKKQTNKQKNKQNPKKTNKRKKKTDEKEAQRSVREMASFTSASEMKLGFKSAGPQANK